MLQAPEQKYCCPIATGKDYDEAGCPLKDIQSGASIDCSLWKIPCQSSPKDAVTLWKAHAEAGSYQDQ